MRLQQREVELVDDVVIAPELLLVPEAGDAQVLVPALLVLGQDLGPLGDVALAVVTLDPT